jgi:hypothetical protein
MRLDTPNQAERRRGTPVGPEHRRERHHRSGSERRHRHADRVRTPLQRYFRSRGAKHVAGVIGVVNDLELRLPGEGEKPDTDIANDAIAMLTARSS